MRHLKQFLYLSHSTAWLTRARQSQCFSMRQGLEKHCRHQRHHRHCLPSLVPAAAITASRSASKQNCYARLGSWLASDATISSFPCANERDSSTPLPPRRSPLYITGVFADILGFRKAGPDQQLRCEVGRRGRLCLAKLQGACHRS